MEATTSDPKSREIKRRDIYGWVEDKSAEIIGHLATIILAFHAEVRNAFADPRTITRFHEWDLSVRQLLRWLGHSDLKKRIDENREANPYRRRWVNNSVR